MRQAGELSGRNHHHFYQLKVSANYNDDDYNYDDEDFIDDDDDDDDYNDNGDDHYDFDHLYNMCIQSLSLNISEVINLDINSFNNISLNMASFKIMFYHLHFELDFEQGVGGGTSCYTPVLNL